VVRITIGLAVLWAVSHHVAGAWGEVSRGLANRRWDLAGLVFAAIAYLFGLVCFALFFRDVVQNGQARAPLGKTLRAFLVSHLGKYVPGKALVVVMRAHDCTLAGMRPSTAAIATFFETLFMMGAGALIATIVLAVTDPRLSLRLPGSRLSLPLVLLAISIAAPLFVVVSPPVFARILKSFHLPFPRAGTLHPPRIDWRLHVKGLKWCLPGWIAWGASLAGVIRAIRPDAWSPALLPLSTVCVALATVAGFIVAVFPGGLFVREGVLMATLEPTLGAADAILCAVLLRLVWIGVEIAAAVFVMTVIPLVPAGERAGP
jgi:hypothetical protein